MKILKIQVCDDCPFFERNDTECNLTGEGVFGETCPPPQECPLKESSILLVVEDSFVN